MLIPDTPFESVDVIYNPFNLKPTRGYKGYVIPISKSDLNLELKYFWS